jgi:hypothetical protein
MSKQKEEDYQHLESRKRNIEKRTKGLRGSFRTAAARKFLMGSPHWDGL